MVLTIVLTVVTSTSHISHNKEDGVDDSVDIGDKNLTHLTQVIGCPLNLRSEKNACIDDGKEDGVDDS
eukprot:5115208-Ditylum_brightwellii.AAC.1